MAVTAPAPHRFTVAEWDELVALGAFRDARVELIDGEIVDMTPMGARHAAGITELSRALDRAASDAAVVRVQMPLVLDDCSEPEPDVALLRPPVALYAERHPTAEDALLVVEIADTSFSFDLERKSPRYGAAGIPECWVVDLCHDQVVVLTGPTAEGYGVQRVVGAASGLCPVALPSVAVPALAALGRSI